MSEVTQDEMLSKYDVQLREEQVTAWVKTIVLTDATGEVTEIELHWDKELGYDAVYVTDKKLPEHSRPEFEYILDCITEDLKYDRDNPWQFMEVSE